MLMLMSIALVVMITERCSAQVCSLARPCLVLPGLAWSCLFEATQGGEDREGLVARSAHATESLS